MALPPAVAKATKRFNPYALKLSSRVPPWATVHHVGRRSGREYRTPVIAFAAREPADPSPTSVPGAPGAVVVLHPLPWGAEVDWCRNIRAAGSYTLTRKGVDYRVDGLRVVAADDAGPLLDSGVGRVSRAVGAEAFLVGRLHRAPAGTE
ncbi:hypothetical protein [Cellulomonas sp. PhB143]|uniref:hypothetical protein n=1 Tax=Cellulomonas sp. PhB143 TaxID=2485186 RepID=UPI000F478F8A|nr:hypothetical protein [Cellulomonas sp. PhB143]ROS77089.1 hypothetical protein EDF32_1084 [Cellulomonas sp. PhB143]